MPGLTFSFPPHPSESLGNTGNVLQGQAQSARDPHILPTFRSDEEPTTPTLYLPPLLSSLPYNFSSLKVESRLSPLTTETRLPDIDPASLSLHKALHHFRPLTDAYADVPYADGFNWGDLELSEDAEREWYIVAFRSRRKNGSDGGRRSSNVVNITHN
jgi:hypothetical protein